MYVTLRPEKTRAFDGSKRDYVTSVHLCIFPADGGQYFVTIPFMLLCFSFDSIARLYGSKLNNIQPLKINNFKYFKWYLCQIASIKHAIICLYGSWQKVTNK